MSVSSVSPARFDVLVDLVPAPLTRQATTQDGAAAATLSLSPPRRLRWGSRQPH